MPPQGEILCFPKLGVRLEPIAGVGDTLAYDRPAITVAHLLSSLGETCVDAGLGVHELWLCSGEPRCRDAAVEFI